MTFLCLIASVLLAGQATESGAQSRTYVFEMEDGQTYYGYLLEKDEQRGRLRIELDDPLKPAAARNIQLSLEAVASQMPESTDARRRRIDNALDEAGYVRVELPGGGWKPVLKQEVELARRAQEMVLAQDRAKQAGRHAQSQSNKAATESAGESARGKPWLLAGIIVLLGAGLAALLLKWSFSGQAPSPS